MLFDPLLMMAVIPVVVLLVYIYRSDPVEKEPGKLLRSLLLWGVFSVIPAIILEMAGTTLFLDGWTGSFLGFLIVENFLVVGFAEELCKFFFLRWKTWNNPAFDYAFDGIVYAVFVSLGFAVAENIGYVYEYGFSTAIVRAFTAIPGHCVFAVFMGYFYAEAAIARADGNAGAMRSNLVLAVLVPMLCHGAYDALASVDGLLALVLFFAFLIAMVVVAMRLVKSAAAKAQRIR